MKILLDTANIDQIKAVLPYFPIEGFTTNPSILAKESADVKETIDQLKVLGEGKRMIHVQVTAADTVGMVRQAEELRDYIGGNFYAKIPIGLQGLRAVPLCKEKGINVTVTAIFTPTQALLAAMAGADYVAPYVDRLDNITSNGVSVVDEIIDMLHLHGLSTQVLAASFKNIQQIFSVAFAGVQAVTINTDLCQKILFHPYTDKSLEDFDMDWRAKFGDKEVTDFLK